MMKIKIKKELAIGISTIVIIALAYWGITFLKGRNLLTSQYSYTAVYDDLSDMKVSSPVYYRGVKIGTVTDIKMKNLGARPTVTLTIDKKYRLPSNSVAKMVDASLLGGKAIEIVPGDASDVLENGSTIATSVSGSPMAGIMGVVEKLGPILDSLQVSVNSINVLLGPDNVANVSQTIADLPEITGNVNRMIVRESANIERLVGNINSITHQLDGSMPALASTLTNIDSLSSDIRYSLPLTLARVDSLLIAVNNGDGTVGKLLHDEAAYDNLNQALIDLQALLTDLKANPGRYVHLSVFGKKDKK